jgi:hypothetical protein
MIVIPPQDPNETNAPDPAAAALGQFYEQFTNVQNLAEFHAALRKRDALYELQHQEIGDSPQDYENLHPKDFFNQFHRRADEDDKTVVSEAPYRIQQQLRDVLTPERDTALDRAKETYKKLFIDRQLAELDQDRLYYLRKMADAASDQDRERYLTALIGRLKLSGDVGLLYKEDADRLIDNIPSDLDIFTFNREFANDPARAQRLLLYGAYPNIRPELREELVKAANSAAAQGSPQAVEPAASDLSLVAGTNDGDNSETNNDVPASSNDQNTAGTEPHEEDTQGEDADSALAGEQYATAAGPQRSKAQAKPLPTPSKVIHGETRGLYPQIVHDPPFPKPGMYEPRNWDTHSFMELQRARTDMAKVVENRNKTKMVDGVTEAGPPTAQADEATRRAWELGEQAKQLPSNLPSDVRHFYLRGADPKLDPQTPPYAKPGQKPFRTYGPFLNAGGGDVKSKEVYIDFYRGVQP